MKGQSRRPTPPPPRPPRPAASATAALKRCGSDRLASCCCAYCPLWWLQSSLGCSSGLVAKPMTPLILKRASASRSSGQWSDDDYDVLENGVVVGRIQGRPWMWASATRRPRLNAPRTATRRRAKLRWRRSLSRGGRSRPWGWLYCRTAQATNATAATAAISDRLTQSVNSSFLRRRNSSLSHRLRRTDLAHLAIGQWLNMAASALHAASRTTEHLY
jgi:hypothetical protein